MASPSLNPAAANTVSTTGVTATITSGTLTTTVNNTRILAIIFSERTAASVTSVVSVTGGHAFTRYGGISTGSGTSTSFIDVWYFDTGATTFSDTIKATLNASSGNAVLVTCGVQNFVGFDLNAVLPASSTGSTSPQSVTYSTSNPDDLVFLCALNSTTSGSGSAGQPAAPTGWTRIGGKANNFGTGFMAGSVSTLATSTVQTNSTVSYTIPTTVGPSLVSFVFALTSDSSISQVGIGSNAVSSTTATAQPKGSTPVSGSTATRITGSTAIPGMRQGVSGNGHDGVTAKAQPHLAVPLSGKLNSQAKILTQDTLTTNVVPLTGRATMQVARRTTSSAVSLTARAFLAVRRATNKAVSQALTGTLSAQTARRNPPPTAVFLSASTQAQVTGAITKSGTVNLSAKGLSTLSALAGPSLTTVVGPVGPQVGMTQGFLFHPGAGPTWELRGRQAFPLPVAPVPVALNISRLSTTTSASAGLSVSIALVMRGVGNAKTTGQAGAAFTAHVGAATTFQSKGNSGAPVALAFLSGAISAALSIPSGALSGPGLGVLKNIVATCLIKFSLSSVAFRSFANRTGQTMYVMEEIRRIELPSEDRTLT